MKRIIQPQYKFQNALKWLEDIQKLEQKIVSLNEEIEKIRSEQYYNIEITLLKDQITLLKNENINMKDNVIGKKDAEIQKLNNSCELLKFRLVTEMNEKNRILRWVDDLRYKMTRQN